MLPLQGYLSRLLAGDHAHLGEPAPIWPPGALSSLARRTVARVGAGPFPHGRWIAVALGLRLLPRRPFGTGGEALRGDVVAYDPTLSSRDVSLLCAHACAHHLLNRETDPHEHADVWLLTAQMLVSHEAAHAWPEYEILARAHAPEWLVPPARAFALRWESLVIWAS